MKDLLAAICMTACAVAPGICTGGVTAVSRNGEMRNMHGVFGRVDPESGAIQPNRNNVAGTVFGAAATKATAEFCAPPGGTRPGRALPCGFQSVEEARNVAFLLLADKITDNPDIEYSTGVEYNPRTKLYYPVAPIVGNPAGDEVVLPAGPGIVENMHYHPQSERAVASLLDFAVSNSTGIPGFIVTGKDGIASTDVLRYDSDGTYTRYQWNDGVVERVPGTEPRMLAELCSTQQRQTFDEIVGNFSSGRLAGEAMHAPACPSTPVRQGVYKDAIVPAPVGGGASSTESAAGMDVAAGQQNLGAIAALAEQTSELIGQVQAQRHFCTSFVPEEGSNRGKASSRKHYRCTECGRETVVDIAKGETIEAVIASNKQRQDTANRSYGFAQSTLQAMPAAMGVDGGNRVVAGE